MVNMRDGMNILVAYDGSVHAENALIEAIIMAMKIADPNYQIIGFINCEAEKEEPIRFKGITEFKSNQIHEIIAE